VLIRRPSDSEGVLDVEQPSVRIRAERVQAPVVVRGNEREERVAMQFDRDQYVGPVDVLKDGVEDATCGTVYRWLNGDKKK